MVYWYTYTQRDNFVPSRRLHEDVLEALKLSTGGRARGNTPGAPAVAKQTKTINSDPLQVQVTEPVVSTPEKNKKKRFWFWRLCGTLDA